ICEHGFSRGEKRGALLFRGLRFVIGRHLLVLDHLDDVLPDLAFLEQGEVIAVLVQREIRLLLFSAVTRGAVLFEKRHANLRKRILRHNAAREGEQENKGKTTSGHAALKTKTAQTIRRLKAFANCRSPQRLTAHATPR